MSPQKTRNFQPFYFNTLGTCVLRIMFSLINLSADEHFLVIENLLRFVFFPFCIPINTIVCTVNCTIGVEPDETKRKQNSFSLGSTRGGVLLLSNRDVTLVRVEIERNLADSRHYFGGARRREGKRETNKKNCANERASATERCCKNARAGITAATARTTEILETITATTHGKRTEEEDDKRVFQFLLPYCQSFPRSDVITLIRTLGQSVKAKCALVGSFPFRFLFLPLRSLETSLERRTGEKEEEHLRRVSDLRVLEGRESAVRCEVQQIRAIRW